MEALKARARSKKSLPSRFFNSVVRRATGIQLHDFNCPFKAYRREVLQEIQIYGECTLIPVLAHSRGFTIVEIKIENLPRQFGRSKFGLKRYLRGMLDLMTVLFITRFANRPMHLLGLAGLVTSSLGSAVLLFFIGADVLHRLNILPGAQWNIHDRPALSLSILLMLIGVQFLTIGLLGELMDARTDRASANRPTRSRRLLGMSSRSNQCWGCETGGRQLQMRLELSERRTWFHDAQHGAVRHLDSIERIGTARQTGHALSRTARQPNIELVLVSERRLERQLVESFGSRAESTCHGSPEITIGTPESCAVFALHATACSTQFPQ